MFSIYLLDHRTTFSWRETSCLTERLQQQKQQPYDYSPPTPQTIQVRHNKHCYRSHKQRGLQDMDTLVLAD